MKISEEGAGGDRGGSNRYIEMERNTVLRLKEGEAAAVIKCSFEAYLSRVSEIREQLVLLSLASIYYLYIVLN